jgi:predicted metalloprotease with PDZ domain
MRSPHQLRIASSACSALSLAFAAAICFCIFAATPSNAKANAAAPTAEDQPKLIYRLTYALDIPNLVHIAIEIPPSAQTQQAPFTLIIPRSVPGAYAQRPYDPFVANVKAFSASAPHASKNDAVAVERDELGPRWVIGKRDRQSAIVRIEYDVDVAKMERDIFSAADTSKIRDGYVGLLGYSIFAFLEGHENVPIQLEIQAPNKWAVFSTLAPQMPAAKSTFTAQAANYYALADSQITLGPKLVVLKNTVNDSPGAIPLFVSLYTEQNADITVTAKLARDALDKVAAYFGSAPFSHYTVVLEYLKPLPPPHEYNFSMEHLDSGTFFMDVDHAITAASLDTEKEAARFNYAHHIAHSWIPKRCYGAGYLPFNWEMTPVIDTIWFNEGFGRYAAIVALADALPKDEATRYRSARLDRLRAIVAEAPDFLQRMSLDELSREGSFLYSDDFRVGMNLFARGALMAAEMDDRIRAQTSGQKSLRDALRYLIAWTTHNRRAFRTDELPAIFREATGVDVSSILNARMKPLHPAPENPALLHAPQ